MHRYIVSSKLISIYLILLILFSMYACAETRLGTIPAPPPSTKLRVFIIPVTGDPPHLSGRASGHWGTPHKEYKKRTFHAVSRFLQDTGIYEVVSEKDMHAVIGTQEFAHWQWLQNDLSLVKQVGKELHADYAIIVVRNFVGVGFTFQFQMACINLESGRQYTASGISTSTSFESRAKILSEQMKLIKRSYRKLFYEAKGDMLATALRKGQAVPHEIMRKPPLPDTRLSPAPPTPLDVEAPAKPIIPASKPREEKRASSTQPSPKPVLETPEVPQKAAISKPAEGVKSALTKEPLKAKTPVEISMTRESLIVKPAESITKKSIPDVRKDTVTTKVIAKTAPPSSSDVPATEQRQDFEKKLEQELQSEKSKSDKSRLVVYDFDATERLNVVSLILTEALREELFILGQFMLVNRENMLQVMHELKLQQSGMVDEKQVVQLGKWLAANEAVTGRLAVLGNFYILQAKRTNIKTMGTLALGSLTCAAGHEDELLAGMPDLARKLVGLYTTPRGNK